MADSDPRAIRHDVFRMLSCPNARSAGLDRVLVGWLDRGKLEPGTLSFNPLEALDPGLVGSRFARDLQVAGHSSQTALDHFEGTLPSGFEEALRSSNWAALEWWFYELPQLANEAPPSRGAQLASVPLQQVLLPGFLRSPASQPDMVALPAGPWRRSAPQAALRLGHHGDRLRHGDQEPGAGAARYAAPGERDAGRGAADHVGASTVPAQAEIRRAGARALRDPGALPLRQAARYEVKAADSEITSR